MDGSVKRVLSIGECMIELSALADGLYRRGFAGDTFNTAWHLRRELPPAWAVGYLSAVGDDPASIEMLDFIRGAGIDVARVRHIPGRVPGLYMIRLEGAERSFSYWRDRSAAKLLAADEAHLDAAFADADAFYFSGITLAILDEVDRARLLDRLGRAKLAGRTVAFDPNIRPRLWSSLAEMRDAIVAGAAASTICLPSFSDERDTFADASPERTAERYQAYGSPEVVVKDGPDPALLAVAGEITAIPADFVANLVDTTGAGDAFSAAYLAARLTGRSALDAMRCGHHLAGEVLGHRGALVRHEPQNLPQT